MTHLQNRITAGVVGLLLFAGGLAADDAVSPRPKWKNLASARGVQFSPAPNYPEVTDDADASQLTDGKLAGATPMWYGKDSVGWVGVDPCTLTIDLGSDQPIRGVAMHIPGGQSGVEWPARIEVFVSDTGEKYSRVGDLMRLTQKRPPATGYADLWLVADALETHGRYVKFVCAPTNLGSGAYIFLDELEVYEGDKAWLDRPLVFAHAPTYWKADWTDIAWRDLTAGVSAGARPTRRVIIDGDEQRGGDVPLHQVAVDEAGVTFTLHGEAGRLCTMRWEGRLALPVSTRRCRYAVLTFSAQGIRRTFEPHPLVMLEGVNEKTDESGVILLEVNAALDDGRRHTLFTQLPDGFTLHQLKVMIVTESDAPSLVLESLELLDGPPAVFNTEITTDGAQLTDGFVPADLGKLLNGTLAEWFTQSFAKHKVLLDGVRTLEPGPIVVSGAPFVIADGANDLALMPRTELSQEKVTFLEQQVQKRYLHPPSRDDALSVQVDIAAREALLLLALSAPPVQRRGGIPHTALQLDDIECISVELQYDRGENEISFPYSLADEGCYVPARELGAYVVAVDPTRRLRRVTLHNHQYGPDFSLAALTFNTSDRSLVPQLAAVKPAQVTKQNPDPAMRPATITRIGDQLTFGNRWYAYRVNLSDGFVIDRAVNRWNDQAWIDLAPHAGLRVRVGDTIYTGRCFASEIVDLTATQAVLKLTSRRDDLPLELNVTIIADESPELAFEVKTINRGSEALAVETCLPALSGFAVGDLAQTRLFFPQYRAADTDQPIVLRAPYGVEFTSQFMDVYNPAAGVGLMVRTDNHEQIMADFTLRKDGGGVSGGVCFPAKHNHLAPGETRAYPPVSLIAHNGDWRTAFHLYRDWVRTWYKPYKSQDEDFFLNAWDFACYRPSVDISWADSKIPPFISADRKRWFIDETFAFEKEHLGHVPDMVHFFNWTRNDKTHRNEYGVFGTPLAYEQVGGIESFRAGIAEIQDKWQRPFSLYTLPDRLRLSALPDQELADALAAGARYKVMENDASSALRASGQPDGIIFPEIGDDRWINFFLQDIVKMQRDTGCKLVYMDVFPYFSHLPCQEGSTTLSADLKVAKAMREALPDDVVLWTEYALTDYASQYADGAHHYYFLDLNETFARPYNRTDRRAEVFTEMPMNVQRFVLTRYRLVDLPVYIEVRNKPSQIDAVFVNGEMFSEDTYRLHDSRPRKKLNRSYVLKHKYNDCFNTDTPNPRVPTAAQGLFANHFPGDGRHLWTLYNGRHRTYSGAVITVPHQPGATYYDAWNDRELHPTIHDGKATITMTIHPQQPGCVVQKLAAR